MFEKRIIEVKDAYRLPEDVLEALHKAINEDVGEIVSLYKVFADPTRLGFSKLSKFRACVSVSL